MLESHYQGAAEEIAKIKKIIGTRKIKSSKIMRMDRCLESYPCRGHEGIVLTLDDNTSHSFKLDSVEIGAVIWFYKLDCDPKGHFSEYINDEFKKYLK